ncbi:Uncharacterised protein [Elizabethkingia miricola]|uniref:DUF308 domain-containing protein n=2 Tax=Elizabethkingia miricola TaxID=172045 RepID=A0ABD4DSX7_ELIMR|nr:MULTISPECIES: hypothetical protein [Elizabethkingia]KUY20542.1 hypothetical protein ATB95_06455 [Elizabethkingia miricola]MCL1653270.1 hypothetical protein [Elizabethkingia miricola]QCO45216.1 hypothetical protein FCS00_02075 [Elizabethkingia sp. 2-6]WQM38232.1 hypothetical protein U2S95_17930 [Elizabethkingia miricola]SPW33816.1 Uncharacterised protein [Elizabethkingia miricola]
MNLHSFNISIRSSVKGSSLLILNSFLFIAGIILSFMISYPSTYIPLTIAFGLSSVSGILFFLQNSKSIKTWNWYIYYSLFMVIITSLSYLYNQGAFTIPLLGYISLGQSLLLLSMTTDLRNQSSVDWIIPARPSSLAILFSIMLVAHPVFDLIPIVIIIVGLFIMIALSYILLVSELKKLNRHYKSIKILIRNLK